MSTLVVDKKRREKIHIAEEFVSVDKKSVDSKNRITLGGKVMRFFGKRFKSDSWLVFIAANGDILLRPTVSIPISEAWIYQNPKVIGKIRKGIQDIREGKTERVDDVDAFFDQL